MTTNEIIWLIGCLFGWVSFLGIGTYFLLYKKKVHREAKKTKKVNCEKLDTIMNNQLVANDSTLTPDEKITKINENIANCISTIKQIEQDTFNEAEEEKKKAQEQIKKLLTQENKEKAEEIAKTLVDLFKKK